MGKKKGSTGRGGVNKSKEIREAFQHLGIDTSPKEVQEYLRTQKGLEIKAQQISNQKNKLRQEGSVPTKVSRTKKSRNTNAVVATDDLQKVASFVDSLGGIKRAKQALEIFKSLR